MGAVTVKTQRWSLRRRFRRLGFWSKLAALGSMASIVAIPISFAFWRWPIPTDGHERPTRGAAGSAEVQDDRVEQARRPRVLFVENRLILPTKESDPVRVAFGLMNTGNTDAVVRIWDRTYFFAVDPTDSTFAYQPAPPEEISISAIPNAIWRGELRFDFRLTKGKLVALNSGRARLFFYARAEYRDAVGTTYPLSLAEMYDATFPGNLIAPPKGIVFK